MSSGKRPAPCPCGRAIDYTACCGLLHAGVPAPDAEALMRSRYSAYVLQLEDYLLASWHPRTRPASLNGSQQPSTKWLGLDVRRHQAQGDHAVVEFIARFRHGGGKAQRLHEISRFVCENGRWYYLDGEFPGGSAQA